MTQSHNNNSLSNDNYFHAFHGHYSLHQGGLAGKHDNVRCLWEDQARGYILKPHIQELLNQFTKKGRKLRIVDLGAGTGQGYELLTSWLNIETQLHSNRSIIFPSECLETYIGCDLSRGMVDQGNASYSDHEKVTFTEGDLSKGFPLKDEEPFQLYFSSYGSLSHVNKGELEALFMEIVEHADNQAIIIGDWLGRNSLEWPCYWNTSDKHMLDYSMSWLYSGYGSTTQSRTFPMQYWLGSEIKKIIEQVSVKTKMKIKILDLRDISIFVGRHVDTGQYNTPLPPLRSLVNRLHESNLRTDFSLLNVNIQSFPELDGAKEFLKSLEACWNILIDYSIKRLEGEYDPTQIKGWHAFPSVLQRGLIAFDRMVNVSADLRMDDPKANLIEPQLGYLLRDLELGLQKGMGLGVGHSLLGIFKVQKGATA